MENYEFNSPTCFVFGKETENKAGELVKRFGGKKVLIHCGDGRNGSISGFVTLNEDDCTKIYKMMV